MATVATDLANGQIAFVDAARYTLEHSVVAPNVFNKLTLEPGNVSKFIPKFGALSDASDLTDGIDMTSEQTLTISGTAHTTDEAGCKVIITRKLRNQLKADAYAAAGKLVGFSMGRKMDRDGLALFSGLSKGIDAGGTVLSLGYHCAAVAQLQGQSEPVGWPLIAVYHPHQVNAFVDQLSVAANGMNFPSELVMEKLRNWWRGQDKYYGTQIFVAGNMQNNTSGTTTGATGALFSRAAFIYLEGWAPENWVEEDKSLRGWEIGIVADYGMVEEEDSYGRFMNFDNTAPSS